MKDVLHLGALLALTPVALTPVLVAQDEEAPADGPRGLQLHDERALDGYTLFAPLAAKGLVLLGMDGEVKHSWETENPVEAAILLDNGNVLCWGIAGDKHERWQGGGVDGGLIQEMDWDGNVVWSYRVSDDYQLMHHDIALLPNGNILYLQWEHRYQEDAVEWGRDTAQIGDAGMWPDAIYEIKPVKPDGAEVVWEWHVWDHVVQDFDESKANYGSVPDNPGSIDINVDHRGLPPLSPEEIEEQKELARQMAALGYGGEADEEVEPRRSTVPDWLHTNAIDYHPGYDLIVLSIPNLNELWILDHSTTTEEAASDEGGRWGQGGEILWRWGNPRNYGAGDDADQQLFFQHDPTFIPGATPDELRLLVFNNGRERAEEEYSSVDELLLPFDPEQGFFRAEDEPFGPEEPAWTYSDPGTFYSSFISGTQRLPNGHTLICSGAQGRVFEVTPEGEVVWDYYNELGNPENEFDVPPQALYRAYRIAADHPGLAGREL